MTNEKTMREAPVWKLILTMGLPVVLVTLMTVVYNMADVFFMGRTGATMQVAAIGLAGPAFGIMQAFGVLLGMGGCTVISTALGSGDRDKIKQYSSFCCWGSIAIGLVMTAAVLLFANPLVKLLGADALTAGYTATYLRILAVGAPFAVFSSTFGNLIRSDGSTVQAMVGSLLGLVLNVLLDPLFISVFGWGIAGAAIATVLGNVASVLFYIIVMRKKDFISFSLKDLSLRKDVAWKIISLGAPLTISTMLGSLVGVFSNNILMGYGAIAVAASGVASKAGMLISMVIMGVCMGIQPAMSYAYGSGNSRRMRAIIRGTMITTAIIGTILAVGLFIIRDSFITAFIADATVLELGRLMLVGGIVTAPIYGVSQMCSLYLQCTDKASYATLSSLLRQGLVFLPVLYVMNAMFGLTGYVFTGPVVDVIATAISVALCFAWTRKLKIQRKPVEKIEDVRLAA